MEKLNCKKSKLNRSEMNNCYGGTNRTYFHSEHWTYVWNPARVDSTSVDANDDPDPSVIGLIRRDD